MIAPNDHDVKPPIETILVRRSMRDRLERVARLRMVSDYEGILAADGVEIRILVEPGSGLSLRAPASKPRSRVEALRRTVALPQNLRYAGHGRQMRMLCDVPHTEDPGSVLEEVVRAISDIDRGTEPTRGPARTPLEPADVQRSIERLGWHDDRIITHGDDGWELRPRAGGRACPVQLRLHDGRLRLHQVLLPAPAADVLEILAHEAMLLNGGLVLARLALLDERLVAETWLHEGVVTSALDAAVRAVACAGSHAGSLKVLHDQEDVRACYVRVFGLRA